MMNDNNPLLRGVRGQIGGLLVFRQVRGRTVISMMPPRVLRDKSMETEAQRATRDKMRKASLYAKDILRYPEGKEYYSQLAKKRKLPNAYTAAVTDYMRNKKPGSQGY